MKFLGRLPRLYHRDTLRLHDYSLSPSGQLPAAPPSASWGATAESKMLPSQGWGMMLNDQEGDCVWAAAGHSIESWTANAGNIYVPTDADIQTGYESTGFIPGNASTDNGTVITQALQYWRDTGISGRKIVGWAEFDTTNEQEWQFVIATFGSAFAGCVIRQQDMDNFDSGTIWSPSNGTVLGGHGIVLTDYDFSTASLVTWGKRVQACWSWVTQACDEGYAPITADWIESQGVSPSGLTVSQLQADLGYFNPAIGHA